MAVQTRSKTSKSTISKPRVTAPKPTASKPKSKARGHTPQAKYDTPVLGNITSSVVNGVAERGCKAISGDVGIVTWHCVAKAPVLMTSTTLKNI